MIDILVQVQEPDEDTWITWVGLDLSQGTLEELIEDAQIYADVLRHEAGFGSVRVVKRVSYTAYTDTEIER